MIRLTPLCAGICILLAGATASAAEDKSTLESTITGNQEQPQVSYIVPWQTPESPTLKYDVVQGQSAQVFAHIERAELQRELKTLAPLNRPDTQQNSKTAEQLPDESQPKLQN